MASAGRILIIPKGTWDATKTYENLDLVTHNQRAWLAKKVSVGIEPSEENAEYWHDFLGTALTAETVGALPIEGGTLDGSFYINGKHGHLSANETEMLMVHYPDKTNMSKFEYLALNGKEDLKNILRVNRIGASGLEMYRIYGEHNKPTASDVGASSIEEVTKLKSDLTKYLPKDGSVPMNGSLTVAKASNPAVNVENTGNARVAYLQEMNNGNMVLVNCNEDNGDTAEIIIPDETTSLSDALLYCRKVNGTEKIYKVYGEHNKPSGTYTGNGSATQRTINTGGIGRALFLSGYNYNAIVGEKGACYWGVSGDYGTVKKEQCSFANGVLTLATVDSSVNANNGIFYWQVL